MMVHFSLLKLENDMWKTLMITSQRRSGCILELIFYFIFMYNKNETLLLLLLFSLILYFGALLMT